MARSDDGNRALPAGSSSDPLTRLSTIRQSDQSPSPEPVFPVLVLGFFLVSHRLLTSPDQR